MFGSNDGDLLEAIQQVKVGEVVRQSLSSPGQAVAIPSDLSAQLNAALTNALVPEIMAVRARERSVSTETLRLTLR